MLRRIWDWLGTIRAGNLALLLIIVGTALNLAMTLGTGADIVSHLTVQSNALQRQTGVLEQLVAGQARTIELAEGGGGIQVKIDSWQWRDPATGACVTKTITTFQQPGESDEDFEHRHNSTVRENMELFPPDPTCR